ncbi:glycosyltransferase [Fervidicoccus fontis]|uniref:Glycosyltransferase n=2 Tax=Fervidicoccus fontis TaxID=683846 RepID=A0A843ADT2_9CREN|nr:glycosyltransferase [Fervidicoccus fontis]
MLEYIGLGLALIHFGTPLSYYVYMKKKYFGKPWDMKREEGFKPKITVIVPTYNEAKLIEKKLDDIYAQEYPRDRLEVILIDSASSDGTLEIAEKWKEEHGEINLKIIEEDSRRGKAHSLNEALKHSTGEVVVITDADSFCGTRDSLRRAAEWFSDPSVGAVSCLKDPEGSEAPSIELGYRGYYNVLRVAESKAYSTPIFHGELASFRKDLLEEAEGFPVDIGSDDSHTATKIAAMGYRAIMPEDVLCKELVPKRGYNSWKIRRAQHLVQHFMKAMKLKVKAPKNFDRILKVEEYLHLVNPWILLGGAVLLSASAIMGSLISLIFLALGIALLMYKPYRTWISMQLYLVIAAIKNLWSREIVWEKQEK